MGVLSGGGSSNNNEGNLLPFNRNNNNPRQRNNNIGGRGVGVVQPRSLKAMAMCSNPCRGWFLCNHFIGQPHSPCTQNITELYFGCD